MIGVVEGGRRQDEARVRLWLSETARATLPTESPGSGEERTTGVSSLANEYWKESDAGLELRWTERK